MENNEGVDLDRDEQEKPAEQPTQSIDFTTGNQPDPADPSPELDEPATPEPAATEERPDKKHHRGRRILTIIILAATIVGAAAFYFTFVSPYVSDARVTGYITTVEKRGFVFKTFEGEMVTRSSLTDTSHVYRLPMSFTVKSDSIAERLQALQGTGRPVTLIMERYNATLPWRGSSKNVVIGIAR